MIYVRIVLGLATALLITASACAEPTEFTPEQLEFFEKEVRPILVARCYECHSGALAEPKGGLRVDSREFLLKGGDTEPALVPGDSKKSLLIDAINYGDTYQMPKKSKMPAEEIAVLTKWVDLGAPWPANEKPATGATAKPFNILARKAAHWSWSPLTNPPVPAIKDNAWPADDLDRFILAKLEAAGFAPAGAAEKRVLIRRVYFDLVGLPPTPEQVQAYLTDESPEALAKVVDELLKSPHFGERWGRHWLDLVRYAESRGHEFDYNAPNAYQYRDYVIRALNADLPYDQFVIEQIAGDLLPEPRTNKEAGFNESILGTGFYFLGEWIHSPVDIRKDEADRFDNMIDVFSKTFMGLTVSCARCHDHKFDAISQADYYAFAGYLQSSHYRLARFDTMQEEQRIAKELHELNQRYQKPVKEAIFESQRESTKQIAEYLIAARTGIIQKATDEGINEIAKKHKLDAAVLKKWMTYLHDPEKNPNGFYLWAKLCQVQGEDEAKLIKDMRDSWNGNGLPGQAEPQIVLKYEGQSRYGFGRNHLLPDGPTYGFAPVVLGDVIFGNDPLNPVIELETNFGARREVAFNKLHAAPGSERDVGRLANYDRAGRTFRTPTFLLEHGLVHTLVKGHGHTYAAVDSHNVINGPLHGQIVVDFDKGDAGLRWITHDLRAYIGHRVHLEITPAGESDLQIIQIIEGDRHPTPWKGEIAAVDNLLIVYTWFGENGKIISLDQLVQKFEDLFFQKGVSESLAAWLYAHRDLVPADESKTREVFARYAAERKKITDQIKPESRLAMAMVDGSGEDEVLMIRGNHRTPGAVVKRRMVEALAGAAPPEIASGSGRRQLAREMVDPTKNPFVPRVMANRVWHHLLGRGIVPSVDNFGVLGQAPTHPELLDHLATRFVNEGWSVKRLIRTIMLSRTYQMASSSGSAKDEEADPRNLLWRRTNIRRLEAETIRDELLAISGRLDATLYGPSVPVHLTQFMQGRGRPGDGPVDGAGRRSIYLSVRRNFLSPMMLAFDAPIPASTMGARNVSNVPAQALILMNDPLVVQQAELWAKRVLAKEIPNAADDEHTIAKLRINAMYEAAYARPASEQETAAAITFLQTQAKEYALPPASTASDLRLWTDLAHVLVNAKEFIFLQ